MATELLAAGTSAASSSPFTLAEGASATIGIKGTQKLSTLFIEMQDDAGVWQSVGTVTTESGKVVTGPGIFRVRRAANSGNSVGAFRG